VRGVLATLGVALGSAVSATQAQQAATSGWRAESFLGSARVAIDATYGRVNPDGAPPESFVIGRAAFAPFVGTHWQVGLLSAWQLISQGTNRYYSGSVAIVANYLPLASNVSRPYVGIFAMEGGGSRTKGSGAYGAQAGWLRFLSPAMALRAESRYRRYATGYGYYEFADVFLTFDPYLFGRASQPITQWPSFGVLDSALFADVELRPAHIGTLEVTAAPFITRWLQVGASGTLNLYFDTNLGDHYLELFGRGYLPVNRRFMPFGEAFLAKEDQDTDLEGSHGGRAGLRSYLTPGVAIDVAEEWRNFPPFVTPTRTFPRPEQRALRVMLRTQFRVARAPR